MVDDKGEERQSDTETNLTESNSSQIGWVTFDEPDTDEPECRKTADHEQICAQKGQHIARLGESQQCSLLANRRSIHCLESHRKLFTFLLFQDERSAI